MSWLFSRALVEASLQDNCWAGDASARSNTMPTPQAFLLPDKTTGAWKRFPSGMTCEPLMAAHGAELLTFFRVVSLAKTSPAPEKASASAGSVPACGAKWRELSVKFDPDSFSWKTVRCLFPEDLDWSSLTLPDWGSLHDGELWERMTQELPTEGSESGCWVGTPLAHESTTGRSAEFAEGRVPTPTEFVKKWPTPRASEAGPDFAKLDRSATGISLQTAVAMWPTPRAGNPGSRPNGKGGKILEEEVKIAEGLRERGQKMFPTPNARDWKDSGPTQGNRKSPNLGTVAHWPTPRTAGMCGGTGNWEQLKKNTTLEEARQMGAENGGQLNPTWVEWLMGWPLGWTAFGASETDKSRQHTIWRGAFSRRG